MVRPLWTSLVPSSRTLLKLISLVVVPVLLHFRQILLSCLVRIFRVFILRGLRLTVPVCLTLSAMLWCLVLLSPTLVWAKVVDIRLTPEVRTCGTRLLIVRGYTYCSRCRVLERIAWIWILPIFTVCSS